VSGGAGISQTARQNGSSVVYRSEPGGQKGLSAGCGTEPNGVFFA
jgi:hypothetical protein